MVNDQSTRQGPDRSRGRRSASQRAFLASSGHGSWFALGLPCYPMYCSVNELSEGSASNKWTRCCPVAPSGSFTRPLPNHKRGIQVSRIVEGGG